MGTASTALRPRRSLGSKEEYMSSGSDVELGEKNVDHRIPKDLPGMLLLVVLYAVQGIPLGLVLSSIPFLLKETSGYGKMAVFSLASYPYSLKLLWSPVVDRLYRRRIGRRKSWILPVQMVTGLGMLVLSRSIESWVKNALVGRLTAVSFLGVLLAATQDIAVDGWALTLLSRRNLAYASTCQSIGLSLGQFLSFTVLLALGDPGFCDKWVNPMFGLREGGGLLTLSGFLKAMGLFYIAFTVLLAFVDEKTVDVRDDGATPKDTYIQLFRIMRLPAMRKLTLVLLIAKLGFSAYDNVVALKLIDAGFPKEDLALLTVIQIPFSLAGSVLAGRLASTRHPLTSYVQGHALRIVLAVIGVCLVSLFPSSGKLTTWYYLLTLVHVVLYDFAGNCLMFVGMGAFFVSIADPDIGGTFLTLVNTLNNFGGTWHTAVVLSLVERLTFREPCKVFEGAKCPVRIDGLYVIAALLLPISVAIHMAVRRLLRSLEALPRGKWRA